MYRIRKVLDWTRGREPPVPIEGLLELNSVDYSLIDEDAFQALVDLILRIRADCIVAPDLPTAARREYARMMLELALRMYPAFVARPQRVESFGFFKRFVDSILEIDK